MLYNFTQRKGPREAWKFYWFFWKKSYSGQFGHFGPKMVQSHNFWSALRFSFFNFARGQKVHEKFISCFPRKNLIGGNLIFLGHFLLFGWAWSKLPTVTIGSLNSQDMISFMITTGSLDNQDMVRILKQLGHDSSGKRLCDRYCMDTMWCLCVEVNIPQRVIWFCEKASLRICYII